MPAYLHYPKPVSSLNDIAKTTCTTPDKFDNYVHVLSSANPSIASLNSKRQHQPFILPQTSSKGCIKDLTCSAEGHKVLSNLSHYAGGASVMALANFFNQEKILYPVGNMNTFGGAGINASARQASQLLDNM